jgi:hypothetical protein
VSADSLNDPRGAYQKWILMAASVLAFVLAIVRAGLQSITQDEGDTYFWFAAKPVGYIWYPFPNNHILNTLLIWITTRVFGLSSITLRMPALLGAALYILICYFLCRSITDRFSLQLPLLICLLYNPFIFDFMAAARGYSLADAFLLAAIAIPVWHHATGRPALRTSCALASAALGLSFAASFSYVFVDTAAFLALLTWAAALAGRKRARVAGYCVVPGLSIALLLCGYPLAHWPRGELLYGANSLSEMTRSMVEASFYQLNPRFLLVELYDTMDFLKPLLLPLLGILCVCQLVATKLDGSWVQDARARWRGIFAAALAGITALSVTMSWLAFHFYKVPLPMTRTGVFLLPLCTLLAGAIAASPARSRVSQRLRQGITGVFICLACFFLLCLRISYFREYQDGADTKDVYAVLARLNHAYGVTDTVIDGWYVAPLNFYRVLSRKETFPDFEYVRADQLPAGKSIYVLHGVGYRGFIQKESLAIVYQGKLSEVVVAVKPGGPIPPVRVEP